MVETKRTFKMNTATVFYYRRVFFSYDDGKGFILPQFRFNCMTVVSYKIAHKYKKSKKFLYSK